MIVRRCAQDYDVVIHMNNKPGMTKTVALSDGSTATLTYPTSKKYFLFVDGKIVKRSDSFETIENEYVSEVAKKTDKGHGRIDIVKHKIINNKVVYR
tara:strand:+ start:252 stop:542 length:291 start_codon:yes stop_codon:yes gene_type:complete